MTRSLKWLSKSHQGKCRATQDASGKNDLLLNQRSLADEWLGFLCCFCLRNSYFMETNILHDCPDNAYTTGLSGKRIDLIGPLSHIAKEAFDSICCLNMPIHAGWKGIKREKMLLVFHKTPNRFRIPLRIFRFECDQIG